MQALLNAIATMVLPDDAQRIFHGRGGRFPGCEQWTLDVFPPVFLLTSFEAAAPQELDSIHAALAARWQDLAPHQPLNLVYQYRDEGRSETRLLAGSVPEPHLVSEQNSRYQVHLLKGQNHGLFLDMAAGRRWVSEHVQARPAATVLNLFAYTCAFSVVALQAGAASVINVDMSSGALNIGRQNHRLNLLDESAAPAKRASFLAHDIFNSWGKISRSGPYDLIILDPPSFQKGSFVATKDYARLLRRLPELLAPGGHAMLCLNTPKLGLAFLQDQMRDLAPQLEFVKRVANPPVFADISEDRSLKVLIYKASS
jgi:23S rRNA (cytosine1962-C5)-methyltransferase